MLYQISLIIAATVLVLTFNGCSKKEVYRDYPYKAPSKPRSSEAIHRATLRPYTINGKRYYPTVVSVGWRQEGIASWYGYDFHGKKTSNGEYYNMYAMTAAHKTLPMNTMVRVTNKKDGRSVVVRINDRGPFVKGRIVDLSYTAAKKIGIDKTGLAPVALEVLGFDSLIAAKVKSRSLKTDVVISGFAVQVGSFRRVEGAKIYKDRYDNFEGQYRTKIREFILDGRPLYRVWLTGFKSYEEASDFIKAWNIPGAFIIKE